MIESFQLGGKVFNLPFYEFETAVVSSFGKLIKVFRHARYLTENIHIFGCGDSFDYYAE